MSTASPNCVGTTETRYSFWAPPTVALMRPSCGNRRSAMSRFAITLMRETTAAWNLTRPSGTAISTSMPSMRKRTRIRCSRGSTWISVAPSYCARISNSFTTETIEASSADSSTSSRSTYPVDDRSTCSSWAVAFPCAFRISTASAPIP